MPNEIETKLHLDDPTALVKRLKDLGGSLLVPAQAESNLLLDDRTGSLEASGAALRLRKAGDKAKLTWKGPLEFRRGVRTREEAETEVADPEAALRILEALGLSPVLRYDKRRETWRLGNVLIMVDETAAGSFVEIEGTEADVRSTARALGLDETRGLESSYATLIGQRLQPGSEIEWP
jgi:adenylate cyclase class 2